MRKKESWKLRVGYVCVWVHLGFWLHLSVSEVQLKATPTHPNIF